MSHVVDGLESEHQASQINSNNQLQELFSFQGPGKWENIESVVWVEETAQRKTTNNSAGLKSKNYLLSSGISQTNRKKTVHTAPTLMIFLERARLNAFEQNDAKTP